MRKKIDLIRDSMIGAHYLLPHEQVFVYPFTDYLSLLYQAPLIFNYWDKDNQDAPVFSTLQDTEFLSSHDFQWSKDRMLKVTDRIGLTIHNFGRTTSKASIEQCVEPAINKKDVGQLFDRLVNDAKGTSMNEVLTLLETSLLNRSVSSGSSVGRLTPLPLEMDDVQKKLAPMVRAIENIMADPLRSPKMATESPAGFSLPNMFTVFRAVYSSELRRNAFKYQAGIRLFPQAADRITDWFQQHRTTLSTDLNCIENPVAALEMPTGTHSRSIADLVFASGIVDFGREPSEAGWDVAGDEGDRRRQLLETSIYPKGKQLFYVPVHAGGAPWICLFTFADRGVSSWYHNHSVYRDVIQSVAPQIRSKAEEIYMSLVGEEVVNVFRTVVGKSRREICGTINQALQRLAQVYPFPIVYVDYCDSATAKSDEDSSNIFYVPSRGTFQIGLHPNCFFDQQVAWCLGNNGRIVQSLQRAVRDYISVEKDIELSMVATTSHMFKTPLRRMADKIAAARKELHPDDLPALSREAMTLYQLSEFASALISQDKKLKLRNEHLTRESVEKVALNIQTYVNELVKSHGDERLSSDDAKLVRHINHQRCFEVEFDGTSDGATIAVYEPLTKAIIDGLLSNAVKYLHRDEPQLQLKLVADNEAVYFVVRNNSDESFEKLHNSAERLNSPPADNVGASLIHWVSSVCWEDYDNLKTRERIHWTVESTAKDLFLIATAKIGEILDA